MFDDDLIPPSPPPPKNRRPAFLVWGLLLTALVGYSGYHISRAIGPLGLRMQSHDFLAGNFGMRASQIQWSRYGDAWQLQANLALRFQRRGEFVDQSLLDLLPDVCRQLLRALPYAPEGVTADDVFRISFGWWEVGEDGRATGDLLWPTRFPLNVDDGTCPIRIPPSLQVQPTYPAPLGGWRLVRFLQTPGGVADHSVSFRAIGDPNSAVSFDYDLACAYALRDWEAFSLTPPPQDGETLRVLAGDGLVAFGVYLVTGVYEVFQIFGGDCVFLERGEVT